MSSVEDIHHATWFVGDDEVIGLEAENLIQGEGWTWYVWHNQADVASRNGLAASLDQAMVQAERALSDMLVDLGVCPACRAPPGF